MALSLNQLFSDIPGAHVAGDGSLAIEKVTADSREAGPGVLFLAVRGTTADGHVFLAEAVAAGCPAVVVETGVQLDDNAVADAGVVRVDDTRPLPALLSRRLAGFPDRRLCAVGVTGTNGKTTVAFLLQGMLTALRGPCGLMGTIRYEDGQTTLPAPLTTPGGPVFYHWLQNMVTNGCTAVALEVSSHALDQERTAGLNLDVAVMTNLGRDHLDYHVDLAIIAMPSASTTPQNPKSCLPTSPTTVLRTATS